MAKLTINANDVSGAQSVQIRYRINNSGATYNQASITPDQLPYDIIGLQDGQYEVGVRNFCTNGSFSPWITSVSAPCALPVLFTVALSGTNFVVNAGLTGTQTKIEVLVTDPNGGTQTYIQDLGGQSGTFNIPVGTSITGNYEFEGRAVCNNTSVPRFVSDYLNPVTVPVA